MNNNRIRTSAYNPKVALIVTIVAVMAIAAGMILLVGRAATADQGSTIRSSSSLPFWETRPCKWEDGLNCHWDAGTTGNGLGHSFSTRRVPGRAGMICVFYVERGYAKHHDYCESTLANYRVSLSQDGGDGDGFGE